MAREHQSEPDRAEHINPTLTANFRFVAVFAWASISVSPSSLLPLDSGASLQCLPGAGPTSRRLGGHCHFDFCFYRIITTQAFEKVGLAAESYTGSVSLADPTAASSFLANTVLS